MQTKKADVKRSHDQLLDALTAVYTSLGFGKRFMPIGVLPIEVVMQMEAALEDGQDVRAGKQLKHATSSKD